MKIVLVLLGCVLLVLPANGQNSGDLVKPLKVAFVISDNFNMIDFAGPWEVYQDASRHGQNLFELYTVAESLEPVHSTGGAVMVPNYTFDNAPQSDIVSIGAQRSNSEALIRWLKAQASKGKTIVAVCTGSRKLALTGLIDGLPATTHHDFLEEFRQSYPNVKWQSNRRYVKATDKIYSAGGLTSGIDVALHVVAEKVGVEVAEETAKYMEYTGEGWKDQAQVAAKSNADGKHR